MQENANQVEHPFLPYLVPPEEVKLPSGRTVQIPKCYYCFKPWFYAIPFGTYGHKEVLDIGEPVFAELAILRVLQKSGWDGVWVDSSRRRFRTAWPDTEENCCELRDGPAKFFNSIRRADGRRGGCFDVFAWNGGDYLFVEAKRRRKEKIRKGQREWLEAALNTKCKPESFLVFEWDVDDQTNAC